MKIQTDTRDGVVVLKPIREKSLVMQAMSSDAQFLTK